MTVCPKGMPIAAPLPLGDNTRVRKQCQRSILTVFIATSSTLPRFLGGETEFLDGAQYLATEWAFIISRHL